MAMTSTRHVHVRAARGRRGGLTLVEAVISVLIVAVMLVAALYTLGGTARARLVQGKRRHGLFLAQQLVSEICQAWYEDPESDEHSSLGLDLGEASFDRANFDDVDDYVNWSASPPEAKDGAALPGYEGWQRRADVIHLSLAGFEDSLKQIKVVVVDPEGSETVLYAVRSRFTDVQYEPAEETTCVTWAGIDLQIGGNANDRLFSGVRLLNEPDAGGE